MNEVLQISLTNDCLVTLNQKASPGSVNQTSYQRLVLRLMPKGRDKLESYFIGTETLNNLNKLGSLLNEHYFGDIPTVPFNKNHPRSHRFPSKPYLFQYNNKHLCDSAITACMRFLLHGLVFKSQSSDNIVIKAHLLRHAFATHLVQVEKVPIDIVAEWLNQKNLDVTEYYSATSTQISETAGTWLLNAATHLSIDVSVKRMPEELKRIYENAKDKVGTLNKVGWRRLHQSFLLSI
jgi:hypothetical protein